MRVGRGRFGAAVFLVCAVVATACVYPVPLAGEPSPELVLTATATSGSEITVTAEPVGFTPDRVEFRLDLIRNAPEIDTTAPFSITLRTADLGPGPHDVLALGVQSDELFVGQRTSVELTRPNIVMVLVDDLDQTKSPYWDALPRTRALIADRGTEFDDAFVVDPICCPSRATLLTGRYSHNVGVYDNSPPDGGYRAFEASGAQNDTIATRLHAAGYSTAFIGKYLNGYPGTLVPPGWDEWWGLFGFFWFGYSYTADHNGVTESYGNSPEDYQTDVIAAKTQAFLQSTEIQDDQPFFALVSPVAPHLVIPPAPRDEPNPFGADVIPSTPNFDEADVSDKPTWLRDGFPPTSEQDLAQQTDDYRRRMGSLLAVDDLVAGMADTLEQNGELDNTVFVFTSDNGYNLLSHRLFEKQAPYDESIRVPLSMSGPGIQVGRQDAYVTNLDVVPTLLDLAGLGEDPGLDGSSLVPLLRGEDPPWRSDFLVEFNGTYNSPISRLDTYADVLSVIATEGALRWIPSYRGVRSEQWLYVQWYRGDQHEYELYDMVNDPYQLDNLLATPEGVAANADTTAQLQARMEALMACAGPTCRD